MTEASETAGSIDDYILGFPPETQAILQSVRQVIQAAAPAATERMAYGIPTFHLVGNLVHFGGFARHVGFYPSPNGIEAFAEELRPYKHGKGSLRFPLDEPMPMDLIRRIVVFRVEENLALAATRRKRPGR